MSKLGKDLKAKRVAERLSLRELAPMIGVSFSSRARIERGVGGITDDTRERVELWVEDGETSEPKERRGTPWIVTVEQRLARIEKELGITPAAASTAP